MVKKCQMCFSLSLPTLAPAPFSNCTLQCLQVNDFLGPRIKTSVEDYEFEYPLPRAGPTVEAKCLVSKEVDKEVNKVEVVMDEVVDKQVEKKVNKVVNEDKAIAVDMELNEGSVLVMVAEVIMKLTLVDGGRQRC